MKMPLLDQLSPIGNYESGGKSTTVGAKERRDVMKSRAFLWIAAVLIGSALALSPMTSSSVMAQGKSEETKAEDVKKGEQKKKGEEKKKSEGKKGEEKKQGEGKAKKDEEKKS
jgi:hypothetical protein